MVILQQKFNEKYVHWTDTLYNVVIYLESVKLPYPNTNLKKCEIKIDVPPNLYDKRTGDEYYFYRDIYLEPELKIYHPRYKKYVMIPRAFKKDKTGWSYICVHPGFADKNTNILHLIRTLQIYLKNVDPGSL